MNNLHLRENKINENYEKLLREIKKVKEEDKNYKPKKYSFNLNNFDEEKNQKK